MGASVEEYEAEFKKGSVVEVSSEDSGLRGSWYTATVLRTISRSTRKLLVEYHNLSSDNAGKKPLREFVDAVLVRPIPPREPTSDLVFRPMDEVDAFHNDGWWEGVVTLSLPLPAHRYAVFFRCSREQIHFDASDLRLHREWLGPHAWHPPLRPPPTPLSLSSRQRKSNGGQTNGHHSADEGGGVPAPAPGNRQLQSSPNGRNRGAAKNGNRSANKDAASKKRKERDQKRSSNGAVNKVRVVANGVLKNPRQRSAGSRTGQRQIKK